MRWSIRDLHGCKSTKVLLFEEFFLRNNMSQSASRHLASFSKKIIFPVERMMLGCTDTWLRFSNVEYTAQCSAKGLKGDPLILADIAFFKHCIYELIDTIDTIRSPRLDLCSVSNLHTLLNSPVALLLSTHQWTAAVLFALRKPTSLKKKKKLGPEWRPSRRRGRIFDTELKNVIDVAQGSILAHSPEVMGFNILVMEWPEKPTSCAPQRV